MITTGAVGAEDLVMVAIAPADTLTIPLTHTGMCRPCLLCGVTVLLTEMYGILRCYSVHSM